MDRFLPFIRTLVLVGAASSALAQALPRNPQPCDDRGGTYPCSYQIQELSLQPSPNVFKFQARVSQAKLPVGEGNFARVIVRVLRGTTTLCQEEFTNVQVQGSVLNLELGRGMTCELDQVIAENADLSFQLCLGGEANCLRPIQLGATPYAIKATFARTAQEAHLSDLAGQASYAHRTTADRDMFMSKELGFGYFDYATPASRGTLYPAEAGFSPYASGGFIQWTPLSEVDPTLHICARDDASDSPRMLERLVLASNTTNVLGALNVTSSGIHVTGASDITGTTTVRGVLKVDPASAGANGLQVTGPTTLNGAAQVNGAVTVAVPENTPAMTVNGNSDFGVLRVRQLVVTQDFTNQGTNTISGATNLGGVSGNFSVGGGLTVATTGVFNGELSVTNGIAFRNAANGTGGTILRHTAGNTLTVNPGGALGGGTIIEGTGLSVRGTLGVTGATSLGTSLRFTRNAGDEANAGSINYRVFDTTALEIIGAGVAGGAPRKVRIWDNLTVGADATITSNATVGGTLAVTGTSSFTGAVAMPNVSGNLAAVGNVQGATFKATKSGAEADPTGGGFVHENTGTGTGAHAIMSLRTAGAGGNPFLSFDVSGVAGWAVGMDNADGEKLKFTPDWNFGTSGTVFTIERNGNLGIGGNEVRFKTTTGDDGAAGTIAFRNGWDSGALTLVGAGSSPNRKVRIFDFLEVPKITRPCPGGMTAVDNGRERVCIATIADNTSTSWHDGMDQCASSFEGAHLCSYGEIYRYCKNVGVGSIAMAYWLLDRTADSQVLYTNINTDGCQNFDGTRNWNDGNGMQGYYCCHTYR